MYKYETKKSRVVFGPNLVMLEPSEEFTVLSLSAGNPKRANMWKALALWLSPIFTSDLIVVETLDHARLQLDLQYNRHFEMENFEDQEEASKLFCVPDFVGNLCTAMASRIRGAVSSITFDDFHKNSSKIIEAAIFGFDLKTRHRQSRLKFTANNLVVTSVDIRSVKPVDKQTQDSLLKSVTLAIEITTQSQEAAARRDAERKRSK